VTKAEEEGFSLKAYKKLPIKYWMLCFITCLSYTVILVFMAFATDLQHTKYNIPVDTAGHVNSTVYGLSILLSPLLGYLLDRFGKLLWVMCFGSACLVSGLLLVGLTNYEPYYGLALIGVAYAALPNAIWPCVSLVCGDESAGTAFGGVTALNSVGMHSK
jgi:MFS family permease